MEINILRMKDGKCPISYHHIVQGNKGTSARKQQTGKRKYWRRQHRAFPPKQENSIDQLCGLLLGIHLEKLQSSCLQAWHGHICKGVELKTPNICRKWGGAFYLRDILVYKVFNGMHLNPCLTWSVMFQKPTVFAQTRVTLLAVAGHI